MNNAGVDRESLSHERVRGLISGRHSVADHALGSRVVPALSSGMILRLRADDSTWPWRLLSIALLSLGYFATAIAGLAISSQSGNIATLWPPNGMLVAVLVLSPTTRWSAVLLAGAIGSIAANMYHGGSAVDAASVTLANLVEALIAASILRRGTRGRHIFQQSSDVMVLVGASVVAAVVAGAMSAASASIIQDAPFNTFFLKWVLGDVLGLVVVMPIAVITHDLVKYGPDVMLSQRSMTEALLIMVGVLGVTVAVFSPDVPPVQFLVMPSVLLASFRLGPFGAAMSTVIVAVLGSLGTAAAAQSVASSPSDVTLRVFNFQLNLAVLFLTALPIGAAMARRAHLERALTEEKERADRYAAKMAIWANVDALTGVATRRHFLDQLDAMAIVARATSQPLTLAMIDVDHFKPINDRCGHAVGDDVLVALGNAYRSVLRADDVIGRLGGEEFAMVMPLTDEATAHRIVDRLRRAVADITVSDRRGGTVSVTISVGVAAFAEQEIDHLLRDADQALYLAKAQGRNRTVLARRGIDERV